MTRRMFIGELKNTLGNIFVPIFSILLPIFMGIVIPIGIKKELPIFIQPEVLTTVVLNISTTSLLCIAFIGYSSIYSQEVEKNIPLRLRLFGISEKKLILTKLVTHYFVLTLSYILYFGIMFKIHDLTFPTLRGGLRFFLISYLIAGIFILIAHSIANISKKFSITYSITMSLYFLIMFLSGLMGPQQKDLPNILRKIGKLVPVSILTENSYTIWTGKVMRYGSLVQSLILFAAIGLILLFISNYKKNKI